MRRWYFWALAPVMLGAAFELPVVSTPRNWVGFAVVYLVTAALVAGTMGLADPTRFRWGLKLVAAVVLVLYVGYAAEEAVAWWRGKPLGLWSSPGERNLFNALRGLGVFGLPALYMLRRGRSGSAVDVLLRTDTSEEGPPED